MSQFCTCTGSCRKKAGSKLGDGWVCVLESAHALMEVATSKDNWRPIGSAPKDGTDVLLWLGRSPLVTGYHHGGYWKQNGGGTIEPTHWQPLPPPPVPSWDEPHKCPHGVLKGLCPMCSEGERKPMTNDEMRIAIAEHLGWEKCGRPNCGFFRSEDFLNEIGDCDTCERIMEDRMAEIKREVQDIRAIAKIEAEVWSKWKGFGGF